VHLVKVRSPDFSVDGASLNAAIEEDVDKGLIPTAAIATLGTTSLCTHDNLEDIGELCRKWKMWLHVDAAYAGGAFVCEELR